ncbi:MAG: hypothetical protein ACXWFO_08545, partial [Candidatus Aminicenantales bacterium]
IAIRPKTRMTMLWERRDKVFMIILLDAFPDGIFPPVGPARRALTSRDGEGTVSLGATGAAKP